MKYLSICSGIEAASVAWHPLGWEPVGFAEINPQASFVLANHFGASRPRFMPDPAEPGISAEEKAERATAIKAVASLPETGTIPNFGDFTQIRPEYHESARTLVGGTTCQDFSVAGLRAGLDGDRGNLTLEFGRLAARERTDWLLWENVPGVLFSNEGRDFGAILGLLSGQKVSRPPGGWQNAGVIPGYSNAYGLAYRVLDAQYVRIHGFGRAVPQRRRRVFVVGYLGDWRRAAAVLFEPSSLFWNSAPRRQAGQKPAGDADAGAGIGSAPEVSHDLNVSQGGHSGKGAHERTFIPEITTALDSSYGRLQGASGQDANHGHSHLVAFGGNNTAGPIDVAAALRAKGGTGHGDFESETFLAFNSRQDTDVSGEVSGPVNAGSPQDQAIAFGCKDSTPNATHEISPTLRSMTEGDSHQNGGGQVAVAFKPSHYTRGKDGAPSDVFPPLSADADKGDQDAVVAIQERAISENPDAGPDGAGVRDDGAAYTMEARQTTQAVAFESRFVRNGRGAPDEVCPPLKAQSGETGKGDASPLVAFDTKQITSKTNRSNPQNGDPCNTLAKGADAPALATIGHNSGWVVRRPLPVECERLQGFPDGYTLVNYGKKPMADGPRYKMLGNSMAVNVMRWLGHRIELVDHMTFKGKP